MRLSPKERLLTPERSVVNNPVVNTALRDQLSICKRCDMPKQIKDEFSDLPISRQRKYQLRNKKNKTCIQCGGKLSNTIYCAECKKKANELKRKQR